MRYRIEYADGRCCNFANSRKELLEWVKLLKDEENCGHSKNLQKRCNRFCI